MKKLIVLIPMILFSCSKKESISENMVKNDTVILAENTIDHKIDSATLDEKNVIKNSLKIERITEGNKIIQTIPVEMLPITVTDEFTNSDQQMVLKIENFTGKKIIGKITPENAQMNIRFNQIKLANGDYDGPFGRDLTYDIKDNGEIWLIIGKSNMASGDATGKFTIHLE